MSEKSNEAAPLEKALPPLTLQVERYFDGVWIALIMWPGTGNSFWAINETIVKRFPTYQC